MLSRYLKKRSNATKQTSSPFLLDSLWVWKVVCGCRLKYFLSIHYCVMTSFILLLSPHFSLPVPHSIFPHPLCPHSISLSLPAITLLFVFPPLSHSPPPLYFLGLFSHPILSPSHGKRIGRGWRSRRCIMGTLGMLREQSSAEGILMGVREADCALLSQSMGWSRHQ